MIVIGCGLLIAALLGFDGEIFIGGAVLTVLAVLFITLYRIEWGFAAFLFIVLAADQYAIPGFSPVTYTAGYLVNFSSVPFLPPNGIIVTPMELHLAFLLAVWFTLLVVRRPRVQLSPIPIKIPLAALGTMLAWGVVRGVLNGGDLVTSLWEVRALAYLIIVFLLVPQLIHSKEDLRLLLWACIAGIAVKAFQGTIRYAALGFSFGWWPKIYETLTNHEDPVFFVTLFVFLAGLLMFKGKDSQRTVLLYLSPVFFLGFVAGQRRASYASFAAVLVSVLLLLPKEILKKAIRVTAVGSVLLAIYLAVFWNSYSRAGYIAQQFKATFTEDPGVRGPKDVESRRTRDTENYNLAFSFRKDPALGRGFGNQFDTPLHLYLMDRNRLMPYIPHNQILWIFVKTGLPGAFLFWFFFNAAVFYACMVFKKLKDPYYRALCLVAVIAPINQLVVSFVDMQLTWYRTMVYLGFLMALPGIVARLDGSENLSPQRR